MVAMGVVRTIHILELELRLSQQDLLVAWMCTMHQG